MTGCADQRTTRHQRPAGKPWQGGEGRNLSEQICCQGSHALICPGLRRFSTAFSQRITHSHSLLHLGFIPVISNWTRSEVRQPEAAPGVPKPFFKGWGHIYQLRSSGTKVDLTNFSHTINNSAVSYIHVFITLGQLFFSPDIPCQWFYLSVLKLNSST